MIDIQRLVGLQSLGFAYQFTVSHCDLTIPPTENTTSEPEESIGGN